MRVCKVVGKATAKLEPSETCLQAQPVLTVLLAQLAQSGAPSCSGGSRTLLCFDSALSEVTDQLICKQGPQHLPAFPLVLFSQSQSFPPVSCCAPVKPDTGASQMPTSITLHITLICH